MATPTSNKDLAWRIPGLMDGAITEINGVNIGAQTPGTGKFTTLTGTGAVAYSGSPTASSTTSMLALSTAIAAGVAGGTFIGANTTGVFDFIEFEKSGVSQFNVSNLGVVTALGGYNSSVLTATTPVANTIQHTQVAISSANILAMFATPIALVAAPAAGQSIIVYRAQLKMTRTGTAYANGGVGIIQYGNTANGAGVNALDSTFAATVFTGAAGTTRSFRAGTNPVNDQATATTDALGLFLSNQTAAFITGTGTAVVDIWYAVI